MQTNKYYYYNAPKVVEQMMIKDLLKRCIVKDANGTKFLTAENKVIKISKEKTLKKMISLVQHYDHNVIQKVTDIVGL